MTNKTVQYVHYFSPSGSHRYYRRQAGSNTPKELRDRNIYQENPYALDYYSITSDSLRYRAGVKCSDPGVYYYGTPESFGGGLATDVAPGTPQDIDVLPFVLEKWRNSSFNAGVTIAEGRESVHMISSRVNSLSSAARALFKKDLGGALRHLAQVQRGSRKRAQRRIDDGDLSGSWLELRYGWLPMVNDIYSLASAVQLRPRVGVIRSSAKGSPGSLKSTNSYWPGEVKTIRYDKTLHVKVVVENEASLLERFGLLDPWTVAWELVPYSFVVDWFLPIGNTLQAIHASRTMKVKSYVRTMVERQKGYTSIQAPLDTDIPYANGYFRICGAGSARKYTLDHVVLDRKVYSYLPSTSQLIAQIPKAVNPLWDLSLKHLGDSVALLHQRLRKLA